MSNQKLSSKTINVIENFASDLSAKLGYTSEENMTYMEEITLQINNAKDELKQNMKHMREEVERFTTKLGVKPSQKGDFAKEIEQFLIDSVEDFKSQGYSEEEALQRAIDRFSEEDFSEIKNDVASRGYHDQNGEFHMKYGEAIGLFYAAFLFLGAGAGIWIGYLYDQLLIGGIIGGILGLGCGLLSNAMIALIKN